MDHCPNKEKVRRREEMGIESENPPLSVVYIASKTLRLSNLLSVWLLSGYNLKRMADFLAHSTLCCSFFEFHKEA